MERCGFRHWEVGHGGVCVQLLGGRAWRGVMMIGNHTI